MPSDNKQKSGRGRIRPDSNIVSESNFALIQVGFNHMDEGISMYDSELRLVAWNKAFVELIEFSDDLLQVGRPIADLIEFNVNRGSYGPGEAKKILSDRMALLEKRERKTFDRVRADGGIVEVNWFPLPGGGLVITYRDVTDRRATEHALRESELRLANAQRIAHIGSWEWDISTGQVDWSDECFRIYGFQPGELETTYDKIMPLMHPDDLQYTATAIQNAADTGEGYELEHRIFRPDGAVRNLRQQAEVADFDANGKPLRLRGTVQDITEGREAENALRESEERYRGVLMSAADSIITMDERGIIETLNPAAENLFGWNTGELVGQSIENIMPKSERGVHAGYVARYVKTGQGKIIGEGARQLSGLHKDGHKIAIEVAVNSLQIGDRQLFVGVVRDITERNRDATLISMLNEDLENRVELLTQRERELAEAQRLAHVGSWEWVLDTGEVIWSDEAFRAYGLEPDKPGLGYESIMARIPPEDAERIAGVFERAKETGESYEVEHRAILPDGTVRTLMSRGEISERDAEDKPIRLRGTVQDVTDQKRADDAVKELNKNLESKLEQLTQRERELAETQRLSHVGSWEWDVADGTVTWTDESYRIWGVEPGEFEPTFENITACIPPDEADLIAKKTQRAVETGESYEVEHRVIRPDGAVRHVLERGEISVWDEDGQPARVRGSMHDITDLKKTEALLLQAQKMEAVGQLTGGIAHDFNNLLAVILGNLEMAKERVGENERVQPLLDMILQAGERGADLTQRLLAFSRQQVLAPIVIDLNEVLGDTTDLLARALGEHIEITSTLDADLWRCLADRSQIENAILNLALNARDAMPQGGHLNLETANVTLDDEHAASQTDAEPGEFVMLAVTDTGQGIEPENQERIFEPFFTTKKVGEGSGLGLSMIYGFVQQSGGHMTVYSEVGEGTTFRIYLPKTTEPLIERSPSGAEGDDQAVGEATILVVEDDPNVRTLAVELLSDMGYQVMEARSGPAALELLGENQHIDLLLTDVVLPDGMSGPEIAARVRKERPGTRILFMSGYAEQAMADTSRLVGTEAFLPKPFRKQDLADKVREALSVSED